MAFVQKILSFYSLRGVDASCNVGMLPGSASPPALVKLKQGVKSNAFYDRKGWEALARGVGYGGTVKGITSYWKNKGILEDGQTASKVLGRTADLQLSTLENGSFTKRLSKVLTFGFLNSLKENLACIRFMKYFIFSKWVITRLLSILFPNLTRRLFNCYQINY